MEGETGHDSKIHSTEENHNQMKVEGELSQQGLQQQPGGLLHPNMKSSSHASSSGNTKISSSGAPSAARKRKRTDANPVGNSTDNRPASPTSLLPSADATAPSNPEKNRYNTHSHSTSSSSNSSSSSSDDDDTASAGVILDDDSDHTPRMMNATRGSEEPDPKSRRRRSKQDFTQNDKVGQNHERECDSKNWENHSGRTPVAAVDSSAALEEEDAKLVGSSSQEQQLNQQQHSQQSNDLQQPDGWRVKLYRLNADGSWDDCGTGRIVCLYRPPPPPPPLLR